MEAASSSSAKSSQWGCPLYWHIFQLQIYCLGLHWRFMPNFKDKTTRFDLAKGHYSFRVLEKLLNLVRCFPLHSHTQEFLYEDGTYPEKIFVPAKISMKEHLAVDCTSTWTRPWLSLLMRVWCSTTLWMWGLKPSLSCLFYLVGASIMPPITVIGSSCLG